MSDATRAERVVRAIVHLLAGSVVIFAARASDRVLGLAAEGGLREAAQPWFAAAGIAVAAFGLVPVRGWVRSATTNACVMLLSVASVLALGEALFRLLGHDFAREETAWSAIPPYFRQPTVPTGEVYFRRPGPEEWTGQALYTRLQQVAVEPNPYRAEPSVTIRYAADGFRNPESQRDWQIAVMGDSFTELGYLPYEELFTTLLGRELGVEVRNLGVSFTGPLSQISYLKDYGIAPSTRHSVMVFFEGNDLEDLRHEAHDLSQWKTSGTRGFREFGREPSMIAALYKTVHRLLTTSAVVSYVSAVFPSATGPIPMTIDFTPPGRAGVAEETVRNLDDALASYAELARQRGLVAWLAYMPCKLRVLHGLVEFTKDASGAMRSWQPTDLPELVSELCARHGIRFVDLTPALVAETRDTRQLLFNPIYDTHLSAPGSRAVAHELARQMRPHLSAACDPAPGTARRAAACGPAARAVAASAARAGR